MRLLILGLTVCGFLGIFFRRGDLSLFTWLKTIVRYSIMILPGFVVLPLLVQEAFPFSHFPMFADPPSEGEYYYVADGEGPLPCQSAFGLTSAKIGKIFRQRRDHYMDDADLKPSQLRDSNRAEIGGALLGHLKGLAEERTGEPVTGQLRLIHVTIKRTENGFEESDKVIATRELPRRRRSTVSSLLLAKPCSHRNTANGGSRYRARPRRLSLDCRSGHESSVPLQ